VTIKLKCPEENLFSLAAHPTQILCGLNLEQSRAVLEEALSN
jgi:hypothetical protein